MLKKIRAILILGRVSNLPTVWTNCLAAWILAAVDSGATTISLAVGRSAYPVLVDILTDNLWLLAGTTLLYLSGTTLNDAFDHKFDSKYCKERPIPSGTLKLGTVWTIGILYIIAGLTILFFKTSMATIWILSLAAAILIYDYVHKKWTGAPVIMGACRTLLWLAAASAVATNTNGIPPIQQPILFWAISLGLYVIGLSYLARFESKKASFSLWPIALVLTPILPWTIASITAPASSGSFVFALIFILWMYRAYYILKSKEKACIGKAVSAFLSGIIIIDAMAVSTVNTSIGSALLIVFLLTNYSQRFIPAT